MNYFAIYPGSKPFLIDLDDFCHTSEEILQNALSTQDFDLYLEFCPERPDQIEEIHYDKDGNLERIVYWFSREKRSWGPADDDRTAL